VGKNFGLATKSKVVAVKVLSGAGFGFVSDVISGVIFSALTCKKSHKPCIANLALIANKSPALDAVIDQVCIEIVDLTVRQIIDYISLP
jgi:cerevisin